MLPHKVYLFVCLLIMFIFVKWYFVSSTHAKLVDNLTAIK